MDILYAKMALPQIPVFQLRIIFVVKNKNEKKRRKRKITWRRRENFI